MKNSHNCLSELEYFYQLKTSFKVESLMFVFKGNVNTVLLFHNLSHTALESFLFFVIKLTFNN